MRERFDGDDPRAPAGTGDRHHRRRSTRWSTAPESRCVPAGRGDGGDRPPTRSARTRWSPGVRTRPTCGRTSPRRTTACRPAVRTTCSWRPQTAGSRRALVPHQASATAGRDRRDRPVRRSGGGDDRRGCRGWCVGSNTTTSGPTSPRSSPSGRRSELANRVAYALYTFGLLDVVDVADERAGRWTRGPRSTTRSPPT